MSHARSVRRLGAADEALENERIVRKRGERRKKRRVAHQERGERTGTPATRVRESQSVPSVRPNTNQVCRPFLDSPSVLF